MGPAVIPSGGEEVRVLYSWKRRLEAMELAMIYVSRLTCSEGCGGEVERIRRCEEKRRSSRDAR